MARLQSSTDKRTNWAGLWYNPASHQYISQTTSLAQIRQFKGNVRLIVRKNKFHKPCNNTPQYQICICDSHSPEARNTLEMQDIAEYEDREMIDVDTAIDIARSLLSDLESGYSMDDLTVEAASFMWRASESVKVVKED